MENPTTISDRSHIYSHLEEFLRCGTDIYHWVYSPDGDLLSGNADDVSFNQIFVYTRCLDAMLNHFRISRNPVTVSTLLGIQWGAAFCPGEDSVPDQIHVIGPVLSTDFDPALFRAELSGYEMPPSYRGHLFDHIARLPVVPNTMYFNYILMLHYAATGEHLERKDIIPLSTMPENPQTQTGSDAAVKRNRQQVYFAEKALLNNVRTGNLNYRSQMEHASQVSTGVNSRSGPLSQSRISVVVFSSLCTRAAIEGGLSPELAYTIGDRYIHEATRINTVTGLQSIADRMYDEFIRTVYEHSLKPEIHPQVRACIDFIDANPEEDITLENLAKRVSYTEYYLSRKFRQEVGCSVNEYMHRVRTERAKLLLSTTTLPIYEIAERLHYSSATHFSDTFRKLAGSTPGEYRERNQRV